MLDSSFHSRTFLVPSLALIFGLSIANAPKNVAADGYILQDSSGTIIRNRHGDCVIDRTPSENDCVELGAEQTKPTPLKSSKAATEKKQNEVSATKLEQNSFKLMREQQPEKAMASTAPTIPNPSIETQTITTPSKTSVTKDALKTISLSGATAFRISSSTLSPTGKAAINKLASSIKKLTQVTDISVLGHTDSIGKPSFNQYLSQKRAEAVKKYLQSQGLGTLQIDAIGLGEDAPIASNRTRKGRAQNRRVDIIVNGTQAE